MLCHVCMLWMLGHICHGCCAMCAVDAICHAMQAVYARPFMPWVLCHLCHTCHAMIAVDVMTSMPWMLNHLHLWRLCRVCCGCHELCITWNSRKLHVYLMYVSQCAPMRTSCDGAYYRKSTEKGELRGKASGRKGVSVKTSYERRHHAAKEYVWRGVMK